MSGESASVVSGACAKTKQRSVARSVMTTTTVTTRARARVQRRRWTHRNLVVRQV
jgi:hypothetical protein